MTDETEPTPDRVGTVVVVGRPNVGKSTLFNRIVGGQVAIVEDRPGVTRDRKAMDAEWLGVPFRVIDTGGGMPGGDDLDSKVSRQVERAVADAEMGELKATSQHYREMMAMWDEAVARRLSDSYPWVDKPEMVSHALNAAGERIMYYDFGGGPTQVTDRDFDATVQIMYSMWCSALGIEQGSEKQIAQG